MIIDFHTHITAPEIIQRRDEYLVRDNRDRERCTIPPLSRRGKEVWS